MLYPDLLKLLNNNSTSLLGAFLLRNPETVKIKNETKVGEPIEIAKEETGKSFSSINVSKPHKMDKTAILPLLPLKAGKRPKIIGIAIGPKSAANQDIINPITPPKYAEFNAVIIVNKVKHKVVNLASFNPLNFDISFNLGNKTGKISLLITAETVLESEAVIESVLANREAKISPTSPEGKNSKTIFP